MRYLFAFLLVLALPLAALAQDATPEPTPAAAVTPIPEGADPTVVVPLVMRAVQAVQDGQYAIAVGLALMILTFLAIRIPQVKAAVPKDYVATFLLAVGLLGSFGAALAGGADPGQAALAGLVCSSMAIAFWEGIAKHVVKLWQKQTSAVRGA